MTPDFDIDFPVRGKNDITGLQKITGYKVAALLAMSATSDPFNADTSANRRHAEWFKDQWDRFGWGRSGEFHLRRGHYNLVSIEDVARSDGKPYLNNKNSEAHLNRASAFARHLGLIDPTLIVDRKNTEKHILTAERVLPPRVDFDVDIEPWSLPRIDFPDWMLPRFEVFGYDYDPGDQPYHLEVWVEKSTMNDILIPICQRLNVNLIVGGGFQSITNSVELLAERAGGRPVRVFYISDFDAAGEAMPAAVARQLEFYRVNRFPNTAEIKLISLALTQEQVNEFDLPTVPHGDNDKRADSFEERRGTSGRVELDALEALHPGELGRIVTDAVEPYVDTGYEDQLDDMEYEAQTAVDQEFARQTDYLNSELNAVRAEIDNIVDRYRTDLAAELKPYQRRLDDLRTVADEIVDNMDLDLLPDRPEPQVDPPGEGTWLYDSNRNYLEQLGHYKGHRNIEAPEFPCAAPDCDETFAGSRRGGKKYCSPRCSNRTQKRASRAAKKGGERAGTAPRGTPVGSDDESR